MTEHRARYGPHNPDETYVAHDIPERLVDLGEIRMNHATVGDPSSPALLLVPGQRESWWGYHSVLPLLAEHFQVFAVERRALDARRPAPALRGDPARLGRRPRRARTHPRSLTARRTP